MDTIISYLGENEKINNDIFAAAGKLLRDGRLVAFPTETVYGLGANALDSSAAAKIYAAKGRPSDNPLIVHLADVSDADKYCYTNELFWRIADEFMPGPITVVLKKRECVPDTVTGGLDTVAIRVPSNEDARRLIAAAGVPIAAPSANISGKPSPTCAQHVIEDMTGRIDMIIVGDESDIGVESTIVKLDDNSMTLLRPGGITVEMLSKLGEVKLDKAITGKLSMGERPLAPGMKYRHYAPDTRLVMLDGSNEKIHKFLAEQTKSKKIGAIVFEDEVKIFNDLDISLVSIGEHSIKNEAHFLFKKLREIDGCGCDIFYVKVPEKTGIGLAVYNRMLKAAGHEIIEL
ncbi:MAG: threonylcarbamoyl-AMP synthase [Clostridia bacterium]|nr:threonylcarbamoyl-AMP synthase [Clostridia bacterium]